MKKVVDLYGWPWDVVRGMFVLTKEELGKWIETEVSSDIEGEVTNAVVKIAFDQLTTQYREANRWNKTLIICFLTIAGTVGAAIIAAIVTYLIKQFT